MKIVDFLKPEFVIENLTSQSKLDVLMEFSQRLEKISGFKAEKVFNILTEREKLGSTGIGEGVAIPHGKLRDIPELLCYFGRSHSGVEFDAIDGKPVHLFFLLLAPENSAGTHLKALAKISKIIKDPIFRKQLLEAKDAEEIYQFIKEEDDKL